MEDFLDGDELYTSHLVAIGEELHNVNTPPNAYLMEDFFRR